MNYFLKCALIGFAIIFLYIANLMLFDVMFSLNNEYIKNIGWATLFSGFATVSQIAVFRILTRRLTVKLVWE